jgi:nucleoside-diphosphate-sugar epimerase
MLITKKPRIILIGGCGFVGINFSKKLNDMGMIICIFDRASLPPELNIITNIQYVKGDMRNGNELTKLFNSFQPDCIIVLASWGMSGSNMLSNKCIDINVNGVKSIIQSCLNSNCNKLIYTSTYNVIYGGNAIENGNENNSYFNINNHTDYYSISKCEAEKIILNSNGLKMLNNNNNNNNHLLTTVLRPAAIYGEGEERHFSRIITNIDSGIFIIKFGNAIVDWVHVDNLTDSFILTLNALINSSTSSFNIKNKNEESPHTCCGKAYFISDNSPINSWEFLRPLCDALGCNFPIINIPVNLMILFAYISEKMHYLFALIGIKLEPFLTRAEVYKVGITHYFSVDKAINELGYKPRFNTTTGSKKIALFYQNKMNNINFFRFTSLFNITWVTLGMGLLALVAFEKLSQLDSCSILISINNFSLLIFKSYYNIKILFYIAWSIHLCEAFYSLYLCYILKCNRKLLWFIQTFLFGGPSLIHLLRRKEFLKRIQ